MNLENIILQVSFKENTEQFSGILDRLIGMSPDFVQNENYQGFYAFSHSGEPISTINLYSVLSKIMDEVNFDYSLAQQQFLKYISENYYDSNKKILDQSNCKITLKFGFDYRLFKDNHSVKLTNADYNKNRYIGVLEHLNYFPIILFNNNITTESIDNEINRKISNDFVNLINSDNFCQTTIEEIARIRNESIDIDKTLAYFFNKPIPIVVAALKKGINYIVDNDLGYQEYKKHILSNYQNIVSHREKSHSVKMKTLVLPVYELSYVAYEKLYQHCGLQKNDDAFKEWHQWLFDGDYCFDETSIPSLLNIIAKLMTGRPFDPRNWSMENQIVFDCAVEEKLGITDGVTALKEYIDNGSRT